MLKFPLINFFSPDYDSDFETEYVRNIERKIQYKSFIHRLLKNSPIFPTKKCIVECIFIPLDSDDNTLLISRGNENHTDIEEKEICFVSFSPIPRKFNIPFSPESIYHREVPVPRDISLTPLIENIGILWRFDRRKNSLYIFYAFVAKYTNCKFILNRTGKVDCGTINKIFANKQNKAGEYEYFKKDHDKIIGVQNIGALGTNLDIKLKPIQRKMIDKLKFEKQIAAVK